MFILIKNLNIKFLFKNLILFRSAHSYYCLYTYNCTLSHTNNRFNLICILDHWTFAKFKAEIFLYPELDKEPKFPCSKLDKKPFFPHPELDKKSISPRHGDLVYNL